MLLIEDLSKSFGGLQVLRNVNLSVNGGEIVGLIGPNGAGKSTLFNIIMGIYRASSGSVKLGGKDITHLTSHKICRLGLARTFQEVRVFPTMSVIQNLNVGACFGRPQLNGRKRLDLHECLEMVGLDGLTEVIAEKLNFAQRRLLEVGRALAAGPLVMLLDEPMAGLNSAESSQMLAMIERIRGKAGTAIFWVEHKMDAVFGLCDRIIVLDYGNKIADAVPDEVAADRRVIEAYLGEE